VRELLRRGRLRELCDQLERATPAPSGDPYRDGGASSLEEAARLHELGRWQWHLARTGACERNLTRALVVREAALGGAHDDTLDTMERIAALHHYLGRDDAGERFEQVLDRRDPDDVAYAITLRNWGAWLRDRGDTRAREVLPDACDLLEERAGVEHPETIAALKAHAYFACVSSTPDHALTLAEQAHEYARRCHDEQHPFVASARLLVARAELRCKDVARALVAVDEAITDMTRGYGDAHPLIAIAISVGARCVEREDLGEAAARHERAYAMYARFYPAAPTLARWAEELGDLHERRGDADAAAIWRARTLP
jgi:hypothetical protein